MAPTSGAAPKWHLLSLPQEIFDIILDLAYPAEDEKRFVTRRNWENDERDRRYESPSTFVARRFVHKVDEFMISKAFFESAAKAWMMNQHCRNYTFGGKIVINSPFAHVPTCARSNPQSIAVRFCSNLSYEVIYSCSELRLLPNLRKVTLQVEERIFECIEPDVVWMVPLSYQKLEKVLIESCMAQLPKLKQISIVPAPATHAKTQEQAQQWHENVSALETLLKKHQKSLVKVDLTDLLAKFNTDWTSTLSPLVQAYVEAEYFQLLDAKIERDRSKEYPPVSRRPGELSLSPRKRKTNHALASSTAPNTANDGRLNLQEEKGGSSDKGSIDTSMASQADKPSALVDPNVRNVDQSTTGISTDDTTTTTNRLETTEEVTEALITITKSAATPLGNQQKSTEHDHTGEVERVPTSQANYTTASQIGHSPRAPRGWVVVKKLKPVENTWFRRIGYILKKAALLAIATVLCTLLVLVTPFCLSHAEIFFRQYRQYWRTMRLLWAFFVVLDRLA